MLEIIGLSASYGAIRALDAVSLQVRDGEVACLLGANGAGKTTILNCLSGVVRPTAGRIVFEGDDITGSAAESVVARGVIQVPEGREIFAHMSVRGESRTGRLRPRRQGWGARRSRRVYEYFPVLLERRKQAAGTLFRRRTADADDRPGPHGAPEGSSSRRTEPRAVADPDRKSVRNRRPRERRWRRDPARQQNASVALDHSSYGYIIENGEIRLEGKSKELRNNEAVREAYLGG